MSRWGRELLLVFSLSVSQCDAECPPWRGLGLVGSSAVSLWFL